MATNLATIAKARNIEYFLISFVDLLGHLRAKLVPCRRPAPDLPGLQPAWT